MLRSRLRRTLRSESGFTLIELLGVAVIMIILALIALPVYAGAMDTSREARSLVELRQISQAVDTYYSDTGEYPDGLHTLVDAGYLKTTTFVTAWPKYKYFFAYTPVYVNEVAHTEYVVGVPLSGTVCTACSPDQKAPVIPKISYDLLTYYIQSR